MNNQFNSRGFKPSLGGDYPYYIESRKDKWYNSFDNAIKDIEEKDRYVDLVSIAEIVCKSYVFSNRTLIQNITRLPWMAKGHPNDNFIYHEIPNHGFEIDTYQNIAKNLKRLLLSELIDFVSNKKKIIILLSGGMDSRICASLLHELQVQNEYNGDVIAATWGLENSRDVVYAKKISELFNWQFYHLPLNADVLKRNIDVCALNGAEFSPIHYHAMSSISEIAGVDGILAASYGDMIGRAEFSGKKLLELPGFLSSNIDPFGVLRKEIKELVKKSLYTDAFGYRKYLGKKQEHQFREIEMALHYMRRKLNPIIGYHSERIPTFQLFTSPESFGYMWSLSPKVRNDNVYLEILKSTNNCLLDIPWARTGKPYLRDSVKEDAYAKTHHTYGLWVRNDLSKTIEDLVLSNRIINLNVFNEKSLVWLLNLSKKSRTFSPNAIDELLTWIASLSVLIKKYNVTLSNTPPKRNQPILTTIKKRMHSIAYITSRELLRK